MITQEQNEALTRVGRGTAGRRASTPLLASGGNRRRPHGRRAKDVRTPARRGSRPVPRQVRQGRASRRPLRAPERVAPPTGALRSAASRARTTAGCTTARGASSKLPRPQRCHHALGEDHRVPHAAARRSDLGLSGADARSRDSALRRLGEHGRDAPAQRASCARLQTGSRRWRTRSTPRMRPFCTRTRRAGRPSRSTRPGGSSTTSRIRGLARSLRHHEEAHIQKRRGGRASAYLPEHTAQREQHLRSGCRSTTPTRGGSTSRSHLRWTARRSTRA